MDWSEMLGRGIYAVPEAARLTGVSAQRIRRWVSGYSFQSATGRRESLPVWKHEIPVLDDSLALSFRDLVEVQFVEAFLRHGVKWKALRKAAELAAEIIRSSHPFSTKRFETDGQTIFLEIAEESHEPSLLDLIRRQYTIYDIVEPFLFESLEFGSAGGAERWHPLWPNRRVVVDPRISFGQPTVEGIPTYIVAGAAKVEDSTRRTAAIYDIELASVEAAVAFENKLAA